MYDYGQMIAQLNLIGLLPDTALRLTVKLAKPDQTLVASPYWHVDGDDLRVSLPWQSDLRQVTRLFSAVMATLGRAGVDTTLGDAPFTLDWSLPETLIATSYQALGKQAPDYVAFHNGWYLRFVQAWGKVQPQLQAAFGVTRGFSVSVLGDEAQAKGAVGLRLERVPVMANTDTGSQTTSLIWLRAALWGVLANTLPGDLLAWGGAHIQDLESVRVLGRFQKGARRQIQSPDDGVHLAGYPQLSLDNQLLLAAALAGGHKIEVLDEHREVLRIDNRLLAGGATLNAQAAAAVTQSKPAVKALLAEAGLPTPGAAVYTSLQPALHDFHTSFPDKAIAVKPLTGQNGQGVRVFMLPPTQTQFTQAFEGAQAFGPVMVEAYAKGAAYRLFVQDGELKAALELTPANVVGDGRRSVAALVSHKNARRPLGWQPVVLNAAAQEMLAMQGATTETVPPRGHQVLLRAVANTVFGADGYDVTDDLAAGYARLAVQAAEALGLRVAGVDMVIANLYQDYDPDKTGQAAILSVTASPLLWPHALAQMGTPRNLAGDLLAAVLA